MNVLDNGGRYWLNFCTVRSFFRTLLALVALLLLLPVMMAGASYRMPAGACASHSCCAHHLSCPHASQGVEVQDGCARHEHGHHHHARLLLMREDARRVDYHAVAIVPDDCTSPPMPQFVLHNQAGQEVGVELPPLYGGYLSPQRC